MAAMEAHRAYLLAEGSLVVARRRQAKTGSPSLRDRFGRDGLARLGHLGFDLSVAAGGQPFERLRTLSRALAGGEKQNDALPPDASCIFCKIVAGQIPCLKLPEDARPIAFMDVNPVSTGHALAVAGGTGRRSMSFRRKCWRRSRRWYAAWRAR